MLRRWIGPAGLAMARRVLRGRPARPEALEVGNPGAAADALRAVGGTELGSAAIARSVVPEDGELAAVAIGFSSTAGAPVGTAEAPVGTAGAPVGTAGAPVGTAGAPVGTAGAPVGIVSVGVAIRLEVGAGTATIALLGADGRRCDALTCAARDRPYDVALFATTETGAWRLIAEQSGGARVRFRAVGVFGLSLEALRADRLMPHPALSLLPHWNRAYGQPDAEDTEGRLRERVFRDLSMPALVPWQEGLRVWLEPGDELSRALLISGLYEPETMLVVRAHLPAGGVFVDVGAHCGMFSLFAAGLVGAAGQVLAFEPSGREFARLQANIAANGLAQVQARRVAIAEAAGEVTLLVAEAGHAGHNTIGSRFAYVGVQVAVSEAVPATTLDLALAGLDRCDVIKMDVEGAELRALRGGAAVLARLRPVLVLEVFDAALGGSGASVAELLDWLEAQGYVAHDIDPATAELVFPARIAAGESKNIVALPRG